MTLAATESNAIAVADLSSRYREVRQATRRICQPLAVEDQVIQSMPDVSPTRWHLAHTTWFFETFVLREADPNYRSPSQAYDYLFNSYYNTVGDQFPRPRRGLLSRPTVAQVWEYREHVDRQMAQWLNAAAAADPLLRVVELGLHHEQQHQELMLTDIKHVLWCNPLFPAYREAAEASADDDAADPATLPIRHDVAATDHDPRDLRWLRFAEGVRQIGRAGAGFAYDNESPRHRHFLEEFEIADRLVTNGEYLQFVKDGGYARAELWLSLGWQMVADNQWRAPLYWIQREDRWFEFTLRGLEPLELNAPVCHVSYFEADAYARWAGARLPTEAEWETAAAAQPINGNFAESEHFHPAPVEGDGADEHAEPRQFFGDCWQWTASPYTAYPGYTAPDGALGEYNGKFMCNQYVLRGGSCATPASHIRLTYRNFFPPEARWQFTGIRLAR